MHKQIYAHLCFVAWQTVNGYGYRSESKKYEICEVTFVCLYNIIANKMNE